MDHFKGVRPVRGDLAATHAEHLEEVVVETLCFAPLIVGIGPLC